jgi:hypothetical protein
MAKKNHDFCIFLCSRSLHTCMLVIQRVPSEESSFALAVRFLKNGVADIGSVKFFCAHPRRHQKNPTTASDSVGQCGKTQ